MDAPTASDKDVRDLADEVLTNPDRAALLLAETALGVKLLFAVASKVRGALLLFLLAVIGDLIVRILTLASGDPAKAIPFL